MTPSQTMPQPGDRLVATIEAQTMAIERAMRKAFWIQLAGLTMIMAVAVTVFVVVVKAGEAVLPRADRGAHRPNPKGCPCAGRLLWR